MGKQSNIKLKATMDDNIYYQWKGIDCIRRKPGKIRQCSVALKNAGIFGMASNRSAIVRSLLRPWLPQPASRIIMHRADAAIRKWLQTNPLDNEAPIEALLYITGLNFNEKNELSEYHLPSITARRGEEASVLLRIPAFDPLLQVKAPEGTTAMQWHIIETTQKQANIETAISIIK